MKYNDVELGEIDTKKISKAEFEARIERANPHYDEIMEFREMRKTATAEQKEFIDRAIAKLKEK